MDIQDIPEEVYREKYLKYKKKYLELSQTAAGPTAADAEAAKAELISTMKEEFSAQLATAQEEFAALTEGATDEQKLSFAKELAILFGSDGFGYDEITDQPGMLLPAIEGIETHIGESLTNVIIKAFYKDGNKGQQSSIANAVIGKKMIQVFDVVGIFKNALSSLISDTAEKQWKDYKFKNGTPAETLGNISEYGLLSLKLQNKQIELDKVCTAAGIVPGFAKCSDSNPNTIEDRTKREEQFKAEYTKMDKAFDENTQAIAKMSKEFNELQKVYNTASTARMTWLTKTFKENVNKDPGSMKFKIDVNRKPDDTVDAWEKNKGEIQAQMDTKSCQANSMSNVKTCDRDGVIAFLMDKYTNKDIDANTEAFTKSIGKR